MEPRGMIDRLVKRITMHCNTQNIKVLGVMVVEKILFCVCVLFFFHCKNMGANDPRDGLLLTPGV